MKVHKPAAIITWVGLAGYGFSSPISIAASQICFGLALLGFVFYIATTPRSKYPVFPPVPLLIIISLYTIWRFLSMAVAGHDIVMIKEDWLFFMVIVGGVMFQAIKNLTYVLDAFAAGVTLMGIYGFWQHFVGIDLYHDVLLDPIIFGYRVIGNFSTYLTFSGFFAIASIFLVPAAFSVTQRGRKIFYLVASQIGFICILFNYSRSTIVALIVGVVALVLLIGARYRKWVSLALLLTLAVGTVISPDFLTRFKNTSKTEFGAQYPNARIAIWKATFLMIEDKPVFGIGPGNFYDSYIHYRQNRTGKVISHAHNDILNVAAESGIPCMIFFVAMWLLFFYYLYKGYRRCPDGFQKGLLLGSLIASLVFLVMSQFEAFFADEEVRMLLMFIWGIGLAVLGNLKASERLSEIA